MKPWYLKNVGPLFLAVASFWLSACNSYERYGDARVVHAPSILLMGARWIEYPKISIGKQAKVSFRVPGDPGIHGFALEVPPEEDNSQNHSQPWRTTIIRVWLIGGGDRVVYERTIDFAKDWIAGSLPAEHGRGRQIYIKLDQPPLPRASSYRFNVEVVRPSGRSNDHLQIVAG